MTGKQAIGWAAFVGACFATVIAVALIGNCPPTADAAPAVDEPTAVEVCQEIADEWVADHLAVSVAPVICVPGEQLSDRGGWYDPTGPYAFVAAYTDRPATTARERAYTEYVIAHEVGHAWQDANVDLTGWHARRPGLALSYSAIEDYADVFAWSLGYDWARWWPERPIPPVDAALVAGMRAEGELP